MIVVIPVGVPKRFDSILPWFPRSGECFNVHISADPSVYRNYVLHVHFITVEVGIVRRSAGNR